MPATYKSLTGCLREYLRARPGQAITLRTLIVHAGAEPKRVRAAISQLVTHEGVKGPGQGDRRFGPEGPSYTWQAATPTPSDDGVTCAVREAAPTPFREPDGRKRGSSAFKVAMPPIAWPFKPLDGAAYMRSLNALRRPS